MKAIANILPPSVYTSGDYFSLRVRKLVGIFMSVFFGYLNPQYKIFKNNLKENCFTFRNKEKRKLFLNFIILEFIV